MADIDVHVIDRGRVRADMNFVLDGYASASASDPNPEHDYADFGVWNLVIETPEETILWDTGPAPDAKEYWPEALYETFAYIDGPDHSLDDDLEKAGFSTEDIDRVVMSHLHLDHAGNLDTFAGTNVPIHVHADELPFAYYSAVTGEGSIAYLKPDFDHDLAWEVVHGDRAALTDGIDLLHLPGHTPGLLGALIETPGRTGLVAGDIAYVAPNYEEGRPMAQSLLWSNRAWERSRHRLRDLEARHDAEVLYGHDLDQLRAIDDTWP
jgi:N-acyl homoserine lactone hydrolase